ncbi:MAG: hypothetical protein APF77_22340 [Clostridia bacterium BRH_c25]|nr:MAG: hypothetical protein APF77_22340 [Clostridia bacterium BRH_c25]
MKRPLLLVLALLLSVSLFSCTSTENQAQLNEEGQQKTDEFDRETAAALVESFGSKLQSVSLQAPKDIVEKRMQENYSDFVSEALLAQWINDPINAPGRLTSSPWPDRIEILTIGELPEYAYEVKGEIIEITGTENARGRIAAKRPITLVIKEIGNGWLIDGVTLGAYEETGPVVYNNTQYGFDFSLPESWKDHRIVNDKWEGISQKNPESGKTAETGPVISIRHPQWTSQSPRQDIPIMIFTLAQWNLLQQGEFHIGAAPVGPRELARNTNYVFALPARYNYAFPTGFEEVEDILESNPLKPTEDKQ